MNCQQSRVGPYFSTLLQLPLTIIPLILLTSSRKVMGDYANKPYGATVLWTVGLIVIGLNIALLVDLAR